MKSVSKKILLALFFAIAPIMATSCVQLVRVNYNDDLKVSMDGVESFHSLFNESRFEEIYELTDENARKTKSKSALLSMLTVLHTESGSVVGARLVNTEVKPDAMYRKVSLDFESSFEHVEVREHFVWYISDGHAKLFSYRAE